MYRESSGAERWLAKSKERRKNVFEKPLPYNMSLYEERESLKNTSLEKVKEELLKYNKRYKRINVANAKELDYGKVVGVAKLSTEGVHKHLPFKEATIIKKIGDRKIRNVEYFNATDEGKILGAAYFYQKGEGGKTKNPKLDQGLFRGSEVITGYKGQPFSVLDLKGSNPVTGEMKGTCRLEKSNKAERAGRYEFKWKPDGKLELNVKWN